MSQSQELIKTKIVHYLKATWYARWIVIGIVVSSFLFVPNVNRPVVEVMSVMAVIYNIVLWIGNRAGMEFLSNRLFMEFADSALAVALAFFSGGLDSPYLPILAVMIVSIGYWFGALAAIILGILQLAAILSYEWLSNGLPDIPKSFIIQMGVYITMGVYVAWLSMSTRSERSELVKLGTEAERERQQLLALINNMGDAVVVIDPHGDIMIHNQMAANFMGKVEVHDGHPIQKALSLIDRDDQAVSVKVKHLSDLVERKDLRLKVPDGSRMNVELSSAPYIVDRQNRGYVLIIKDVTGDKTLDKERAEFIAVASHELRTPLTIAQGNLSLLQSPAMLPDKPEAVARVESAMRSLKQLSNIINDLTDLALIDTRRLDIDLELLDPRNLLKELEADYLDQVRVKGLTLVVDTGPAEELPPLLTSSYVVREVLTIFINNALKFTETGSLTLAVKKVADRPDGVTFSVTDTGMGISRSDQKKLFQKFFQSERYMTRVHGGTGLGLYISKKLAERLTGEVWFTSELGKGSTFYLWVPPYSQDKADRHKVASAETKDLFSNI